MKYLLLIVSITFASLASAQGTERVFHGGLFAGAATTQIDGDGYAGFNKAGIWAGAFINSKLTDKWRGELQLSFVQKGSINPYRPDQGDFSYYRIALQYVEVPLLFRRKHGKFVYGFGPSFGVLISSLEEDLNGEVTIPFHTFKGTEVALSLDLVYQLLPRLESNVRYTHSMLPVSNQFKLTPLGLVGGSFNMALNFGLRYRLSKACLLYTSPSPRDA